MLVLFLIGLLMACGSDDGGDEAAPTTTARTDTDGTDTDATTTSATAPTSTPALSTTARPSDGPPATTTTAPAPGPSTTAAGASITIELLGGEPVGGAQRQQVRLGSELVLEVMSDEADELHVHGYDLDLDVEAGVITTLRFTADLPGVFEVESHLTDILLLELEVS